MIRRIIPLAFDHRVLFTRDAFDPANHALVELISEGDRAEPARLLVLIDSGVAAGNAELAPSVTRYARVHAEMLELAAPPVVMPGGEPCKNDWSLVERIWQLVNDHGIDRHSFIIAIGGGAFQDLACFAASTAHRGIRHIRFPTTTLSQGDGGVGVKNGVNFFGKKNWVGTFTVPFAVVNDFRFLETLPERARRDGIIEAIKVALIRDAGFFTEIESIAGRLAALDQEALEFVVQRSAELHVEHIATGGDPFERGSARPLDFGHWAAHKLEQVSGFRVSHGEAVAIGMAVDLVYSARIGLLDQATITRVLALIQQVGFDIFAPELMDVTEDGQLVILAGLEEFREHLGGELTVTLVPEIGRKIEVHEMDRVQVKAALEELSRLTAGAATG